MTNANETLVQFNISGLEVRMDGEDTETAQIVVGGKPLSDFDAETLSSALRWMVEDKQNARMERVEGDQMPLDFSPGLTI